MYFIDSKWTLMFLIYESVFYFALRHVFDLFLGRRKHAPQGSKSHKGVQRSNRSRIPNSPQTNLKNLPEVFNVFSSNIGTKATDNLSFHSPKDKVVAQTEYSENRPRMTIFCFLPMIWLFICPLCISGMQTVARATCLTLPRRSQAKKEEPRYYA